MKRLFLIVGFLTIFSSIIAVPAHATSEFMRTEMEPIACAGVNDPRDKGCVDKLKEVYAQNGEACVDTYTEFVKDPVKNHFWAEDPEITAQGKADERARQFIYWVINNSAIDSHPVIRQVWLFTSGIATVLAILMAAILGLGIIVSQRTNFDLKIQVWPQIRKIALALLFIFLSYAILLMLIQLSEVLMKFFIDKLGGKDLFNIYFSGEQSSIKSYKEFYGCRDLNFRVQEGVQSEMFLLKVTNITYYVMGIMLLLRKILLWFLIFVSPFLALLMPFVFIRNTGWIWIGVFFQWLFYGPLFALFLSATSTIWKAGIPFPFVFTGKVNELTGYIYPTAINLVYGGPAQTGANKINARNNGNYIDTFAEYVISLIMLWAVTFFPWWLLRIFRDYCCEGIYAMKNILLSVYDQLRTPPPGGAPGPVPTNSPSKFGTTIDIKTPNEVEVPVRVKLETVQEIRQAKTEDISRSLNVRASNLTDIARFETNKQTNETVRRNLNYLSNPTQASTPAERQQFMNLRTELFNRAIKEDQTASRILSATSTSRLEQIRSRQELLKSTPAVEQKPVTHLISIKVSLPQEKVASISNSVTNAISNNTNVVNNISTNTQVPTQQVQTILNSYKQNVSQPAPQVVSAITTQTGIAKEKVVKVIKDVAHEIATNKELAQQVATQENIKQEQVQKVVAEQVPLVAEPEKHVEQNIAIPASVSIEDYEEVKKMWTQQYEKGEVPVTENVKTRAEWVEQDVVLITNVLNKLMSSDEKLKQEGLDEIGYILPIFMINNLKGEELLVYLKAKLEAAKAVEEQMQKEKDIEAKLKSKSEEELVDLEKPKQKEEAKTMDLEQGLEIPDEKKADTPPTSTGPQTPINTEAPTEPKPEEPKG